MRFNGSASFARGVKIIDKGLIEFGDDFSANRNCLISCDEKIVFDDHVLLGWNCAIRDGDGHGIIHNKEVLPNNNEICIGNHVWIVAETHILKGTAISDDCVVAYRSLVTNKFNERSILIGGSPAKKIKDNISWIR